MSETKSPELIETHLEELSSKSVDIYEVNEDNKGWYTKRLRLGAFKCLPYNASFVQLLMTAFVCFLCPGMYNSLSGMGQGGGQVDTSTSNIASLSLSCVSTLGFFYGSICNKLGVNRTLALGGIGYSVYAASFLCFNITANRGFVIFAGALLGFCCNFLWSAQGSIMMSYPTEGNKGKYISVFWIIFNLGAVIGAIIPLANNIHVTTAKPVANGTYAAFMVLMFLGAVVALFLLPAGKVIKSDGTRVIIQKNPSWKSEIRGFASIFRTDTYILSLFPLFFASNFFYTYQQNDLNAAKFDTRTRSLNSLLYWLCQMFGALFFGYLLDMPYLTRPKRARVGIVVLFLLTMAIWGGGYAVAKQYTRKEASADDWVVMDWDTSGYVGVMFLYMFYGAYDAVYQTFCYWLIGSLTNNSRKLSIFAGFYKGVQGIGGIVIYVMDWKLVEYHAIFGTTWGIICFGILMAFPIAFRMVKDSTELEKDLEFSDETLEDVIPKDKLEVYLSNHEEKVSV
ncbi:unnamed protein product [Kuraishia capsulata CBS 1993]|uniref:Major facilitator superfamily (MFS) profile domain-containing protein n=1 Tax=Kuraishia capsulata CBS 1993 TaxID=1382522 RepID=W6MQ19_9ASCO|nr:uncharacterized protein KUCA_T00004756001 [Kuraishia capsulata CBS 1993]CDK28771.1 unnamed protein product [Kuraishia capsulata CBS 1993]